jgi:hypothetical protein
LGNGCLIGSAEWLYAFATGVNAINATLYEKLNFNFISDNQELHQLPHRLVEPVERQRIHPTAHDLAD